MNHQYQWNFYVEDADRSWGFSNHVYTLGFIGAGYGNRPEVAWEHMDPDLTIKDHEFDLGDTIAIRSDHEEGMGA